MTEQHESTGRHVVHAVLEEVGGSRYVGTQAEDLAREEPGIDQVSEGVEDKAEQNRRRGHYLGSTGLAWLGCRRVRFLEGGKSTNAATPVCTMRSNSVPVTLLNP